MKVLIVSDTHGHDGNLEKVLKKIGPIDQLIHLGDVEGRENYIAALANCPSHIISGNNDFFSDLPREDEFDLGNYHIFITHGHTYGVSMGMEYLKEEGRARKADIIMFGHTHKPSVEQGGNMTVINPGSLAYPRQVGRAPSFIIMEIDRKGDAHFTINYL